MLMASLKRYFRTPPLNRVGFIPTCRRKVLQDKGVVYAPTKGELESEGKKVEINPSVVITQTGKGEINIIKGIDLNNYHNDATGVAKTFGITNKRTIIPNLPPLYGAVGFYMSIRSLEVRLRRNLRCAYRPSPRKLFGRQKPW